MTALRVACVGTGFIAGKHLAALAAMPEVQVVAVADAVLARAEAAADAVGARAYDDGLALLAHEDLDAVWLCVPPFAHGLLEQAALDRSLPFFVEKPIALDVATAEHLAGQVRARGVLAAVGYHWRHLDVVRHAAAALDGAPVQLLAGSWWDRTPAAPWWSRRGASGGQLVEQTTHLVDLARHLAGEVESVASVESALPRPAFPDADAPTASGVLLRLASGGVGTMTSTCLLEWRHRVSLQLVVEGAVVELVERGLVDHELRVTTAGGVQVVQSDQDPVAAEDREFVDVLLGRSDRLTVPYEQALATQRLVCAADEAARAGATAHG